MQVGDLVELSAYGRKRCHSKSLWDKMGLVIEYKPSGFYWKVQWFETKGRPYYISRKDIKHVKVKKST
jgi:hypothetical protein